MPFFNDRKEEEEALGDVSIQSSNRYIDIEIKKRAWIDVNGLSIRCYVQIVSNVSITGRYATKRIRLCLSLSLSSSLMSVHGREVEKQASGPHVLIESRRVSSKKKRCIKEMTLIKKCTFNHLFVW